MLAYYLFHCFHLFHTCFDLFQTGLSAREAYCKVIYCPSAKGIDAATLRSACEVTYEGSRDAKRKTVEEATEENLLRPQKVIVTV